MHILKQLAMLFAICVAGDLLSACIGNFLPGNVIGLLLLLALLICGRVKEAGLRETAQFFESNMAIFFLPSCLGILDLSDEVRQVLVPIVFVVLISTILTALAAAGTVKLVSGLEKKRKAVR